MKRIAVIIETSDEKWLGLCNILQNSLDESNSDLRVTEYQTYEENETYPDIENCIKLSALFHVSLDAFVKEPIQLMLDEPNDKGQYLFGIVKVDESGSVPLPDKALSLMEILPGDRMLLLGDRTQGIAIVKCDGINDYLEMEEKS